MSYQAVRWALTLELPSTPKLVLVAMADRANKVGDKCYPGVQELMDKARCARRTVFYALKELQRIGLVKIITAGGGRGRRVEYRLCMENHAPVAPFKSRKRALVAPFNDGKGAPGGTERVHLVAQKGAPGGTTIEVGTTMEGSGERSFTVEQVQPAFSETFTRRLERATNKVGTLGDIFLEILPPAQPFDAEAKKTFYGRIAAVYRIVGNRSDVALGLVRETYKAQPRGDPVDYLQAAAKEHGQRSKPRRGPGRHDATLDELKEAARRHREQTGDT